MEAVMGEANYQRFVDITLIDGHVHVPRVRADLDQGLQFPDILLVKSEIPQLQAGLIGEIKVHSTGLCSSR